ncbi:cystathionine gamma-synthase family protein [Dongia mobilis]|uniref:cystathionine gamma-synthase family protein n=1 Tax=Dongia sp. TaxID=1977262 RepID=UPI0026EE5FB7
MKSSYRQRSIGNRKLSPETLMTSYGYDPFLSEGSVKPPVFLTSTFAFKSAEDGKDFFDYVAGRKTPPNAQDAGLVYSRFNHPNLQIVEERLAVLEGGEGALMFASGMAAITAAILAFARPGDTILHSQPLYGGTETLLVGTLAPFGLKAVGFMDGLDEQVINAAVAQTAGSKVPIIYVESPANPTCGIVDFELMVKAADAIERRQGSRPLIVVDNTMLGPIFQQPLQHGADIIVYSLTKYVGGHSDLVAGGVIGRALDLVPIKKIRSAFGMQLDPHSSWMLGRSLETLHLRMERASNSAAKIARWLHDQTKVDEVYHPDLIDHGSYQRVYRRTAKDGGSTFSFTLKSGQEGAFRFLNDLHLFTLAVSLGGTESLISHPASTTHSGVAKEIRDKVGVTDSLIRVSVGLENPDDLIADLAEALEKI